MYIPGLTINRYSILGKQTQHGLLSIFQKPQYTPLADAYAGLCESSFLQLEYSVEILIEYSSTRLILEVAVNYRVAQNKLTPGSSFNA